MPWTGNLPTSSLRLPAHSSPPAATGPARGSVPRQRRSEGCEPRAARLDRDAATPPHVHLDSVLPAGGGRLRTLTRARTGPCTTRRDERDPERWQMASQLVTHVLIRDAGCC